MRGGLGRRRRDTEADPFYDMLFNLLIAFVLALVLALVAFNPEPAKVGDVPAKAEMIITVSWPDDNPNDIDAWALEPSGKTLWFRQRDAGMLHLDRDDRGDRNNSQLVDGRVVSSATRQEIITLRGRLPGEYVINAHYYDSRDGQAVDVTVLVVQINPQARIVYTGSQRIQRKGDEKTLIRFTLDDSGIVSGLSTQPKTMVQRMGL